MSGVPAKSQKAVVIVDPIDRHAALIVRGAIVCTGLAGLAVIARSLRLFSKFQHVRDIPAEFIKKERTLTGTLKSVQLDGSMRVEHKPILLAPRPFRRITDKDGLLTIRPAGIEVSEAGRCFLRENYSLLEKPMQFTLIKKTTGDVNSVDCELWAKTKQGRNWKTSLNTELIRRGLARIPGPENVSHLAALKSVPAYSRLVNKLLISEKIADRRGVGMWDSDTWVEWTMALPYQVKDMVRTAAVTRFVLLVAHGTKKAVMTTAHAVRRAFDLGVRSGRWLYLQSQRARATALGRRLTSSATDKTS